MAVTMLLVELATFSLGTHVPQLPGIACLTTVLCMWHQPSPPHTQGAA
jgi:hypothetical protein